MYKKKRVMGKKGLNLTCSNINCQQKALKHCRISHMPIYSGLLPWNWVVFKFYVVAKRQTNPNTTWNANDFLLTWFLISLYQGAELTDSILISFRILSFGFNDMIMLFHLSLGRNMSQWLIPNSNILEFQAEELTCKLRFPNGSKICEICFGCMMWSVELWKILSL